MVRVRSGVGSGMSGMSGMAGAGGLSLKVRDEFTDTNGTLLGSHTIAPTNVPSTSWGGIQGGADIQSNQANATSTQTRFICNPGAADGEVRCDVIAQAADGRHGVVVRAQDASNFWFVGFQSSANTFYIEERNAGTFTVRASVGKTINGGQTYAVRAVLSGSNIAGTIDGGSDISYGSATFLQSQTAHGLVINAIGAKNDNFEFWA